MVSLLIYKKKSKIFIKNKLKSTFTLLSLSFKIIWVKNAFFIDSINSNSDNKRKLDLLSANNKLIKLN